MSTGRTKLETTAIDVVGHDPDPRPGAVGARPGGLHRPGSEVVGREVLGPEALAALPAELEIEAVGPCRVAGMTLRSVRRVEGSETLDATVDELARFLHAMRAHRETRVVVQYRTVRNPFEQPCTAVEIIVVAPVDGGARARAIVADAARLLEPQRRWFELGPLTTRAALRTAVVDPPLTSVVEIARAELTDPNTRGGMGFQPNPATAHGWAPTPWTIQPDSRGRLLELLAQADEPRVVRVVLRPTELTGSERRALRASQQRWDDAHDREAIAPDAQRALGAIAAQAELWESAVYVASAGPMSATWLASLAAALVPIGRAEVIDPTDVDGARALRAAFRNLSSGGSGQTASPAGLGRVRRVLGLTETVGIARLPVAVGGSLAGVRLDPTPSLARRGPHRHDGLVLGRLADAPGDAVHLGPADRARHLYLVGQTGTGKSTEMLDLIVQDMERGEGVGVIDPHGDLAEAVMARVPAGREDDVVLVDPADPDAVVGVNLLEPESALTAEYLVSDLCEFFQNLFDPRAQGIVGPRFQSWLRYGAQTLMAVPDAGTICDLPRCFTDDQFLLSCFRHVADPLTQDFWTGEMAQTDSHTKSEMLGWFNSKFEPFRTSRLVRRVLGQARSTVSFRDILDQRRILVVKLAKGLMGSYNTTLMGYVVFAKLWGAALERATQAEAARVPFTCYVDEFQAMLGTSHTSLPDMLSEARKFGLSLVLANQFLSQIPDDARHALFGNVGSTLAFRLGGLDAKLYAELAAHPDLHASHLMRLPNFTAVARVLADGEPADPFLLRTLPPTPNPHAEATAARVRERSRRQWARPVRAVDRDWELTFT